MPSRIDQRRRARKQRKISVSHAHAFHFHFGQFLLGCFGIVIFSVLVYAWFLFRQSNTITSTQNILFVQSNLDGQKGNIVLLHISLLKTEVEVGVLPSELSVDILGGYGKYPLRSVFPLLALDKKSPEFMKAAYSYALNIPINEVVSADQPQILNTQPNMKDLSWKLLTYKLHSQMSFKERLSLYRFLQKVDVKQIDIHPVETSEKWQTVLSQFRFSALSPDCAVAILNTTTVAGTGSSVTQVLEKSGIPVVRLTDTADQLQGTKIILNRPAPFCQEVLEQLRSLFPFSAQYEIDHTTMDTYRANVVVLIGQDLAQEFAKKPKN
jgi:hypothetical protein